MMNLELIATVRTHLLQQNAKSLNQQGRCLYRGPEGKKCAIGCLIPDDRYEERFEGHGFAGHSYAPGIDISNPSSCFLALIRAAGISPSQLPLAAELQAIHDSHPVEEWAARLDYIEADEQAIAKLRNLDSAGPTSIPSSALLPVKPGRRED